jgi:hypothetical protein
MSDAFMLQSIPELVNDALFGGANLAAAQVLLVAVLMLMCMLPMMMARIKGHVMIPMLVIVILACTAIGWVSDSIVMVLLLIMAGSLAMAGAKWVKD